MRCARLLEVSVWDGCMSFRCHVSVDLGQTRSARHERVMTSLVFVCSARLKLKVLLPKYLLVPSECAVSVVT